MNRHAATTLTLPLADDLHVHLRQDDIASRVAPLVRSGGVGRCLVMPNTRPPIGSAGQALRYREELLAAEPQVEFLMSLFLGPDLTPDEVVRAADAGVCGVKCYPQGVTTHSEDGVSDLSRHDDIFAAMETAEMVLQLHGEMPSCPEKNICVMNAEEAFLPELERIHRKFPHLRVVMEHVSTRAAADLVGRLGDTVAATITPQHLELTVDDWAGKPHNFCKPVAKYPDDRAALRAAVREGNPKFFLGSDSAPHPRAAKEAAQAASGVFSSPLLLAYLADTFDRLGCLDRLRDFTSGFGSRFYGLAAAKGTVTLERRPQRVPDAYGDIVPFRAGEALEWSIAP